MNDIYCMIFLYLKPIEILHTASLLNTSWNHSVLYYSRHHPSFRLNFRIPVPLVIRDSTRYDKIFLDHPMLPNVQRIMIDFYEKPNRNFYRSDYQLLVYPAVARRLRRFLEKIKIKKSPDQIKLDFHAKDPEHDYFIYLCNKNSC